MDNGGIKAQIAMAQGYMEDLNAAYAARRLVEEISGVRSVRMGDPVLEGRGTPCRPDEPIYLTPKQNCRNCGASPEPKHPHACGWCATPR